VTSEDQAKLVAQLKIDEGFRSSAYQDSLGFWTIGYGRLVDQRKNAGITPDEGAYLLRNDIAAVSERIVDYAWYSAQDSVRQAALVNMAFNLGLEGLLHFPHFLASMSAKDYPKACAELESSLWRRQVGVRADRIIKQIGTGTWSTS
jgi:lysozyme